MAIYQLAKGGTADIKNFWCENDVSQFHEPFGNRNFDNTPPFDAHVMGETMVASFAVGYPILPDVLPVQKKQMDTLNGNTRAFAVDDFLSLLILPVNHWIDSVRFDVNAIDASMAGATVKMDAYLIQWNPTTSTYDWTRDPRLEAAATAQLTSVNMPLDVQGSYMVWPTKISDEGYPEPIYAAPQFVTPTGGGAENIYRDQGGGIAFGLTIVTNPTPGSDGVQLTLADSLADMYFTARFTGHECLGSV